VTNIHFVQVAYSGSYLHNLIQFVDARTAFVMINNISMLVVWDFEHRQPTAIRAIRMDSKQWDNVFMR
jgi:hypothetical protein